MAFQDPERGIAGATRVAYDDAYFFDLAAVDAVDTDVVDRRALSVRLPVNLESTKLDTWPAWLLDLMPQGVARQRLAKEIGLRNDDPAVDLRLLLRAGGAPIGNLRIKEAWEAEQRRIKGVECPPLTDREIATRSERFLDVMDRFAHLASGSSGVQGEWPKALMTRHVRDGFWYPDPFVPTDEGVEHAIVKLLRSSSDDDALIIGAEAPYLSVARAFGLNVAAPLAYHTGILRTPRFDRTVADGRVLSHGQESLVSALGVAEFGHLGHHEDYLAVIRAVSDDPAADTLEYVLRDVLNAAMGNPDNHGRNTALAKRAEGGIRLAPLYDFAPMRLSPSGIGRATRWRRPRGHDLDGQWAAVCEAAACDGLPADAIRTALVEKVAFLRDLPRIAAEAGVHAEVIRRAFGAGAVADALERLEEAPCPGNGL
ncbi:MAG: HipA domain-containing protein [Alphaproteobacteria bacterium]|nr:HipA domain-containing protein [Alphaproteobacteria bacterium]